MSPATLKKIVAIGPESTGKSTLCQQLAAHFQTLWCPEYAREFLLKHGMNYSYDDLLTIAKGQIALEEEFEEKARQEGKKLLIIDTDMQVMKTWCEFVFGKVHPYIREQIQERKYDLYLLCNVDLPWIKDELREYPDLERRKQLYEIYKETMRKQPVRWVGIEGNYDERLTKAIAATESVVPRS